MKIELRALAEIKPYEKNPRLNDDAVEAVARSIGEFGFRQPIVVDVDGVIVCGHTRWKAAARLGLERVPIHVGRELTPEQAKAYRLADHASADLATWDLELLPGELAELKALDIDLGLLGFDEDELAELLDPGVKHGVTDPTATWLSEGGYLLHPHGPMGSFREYVFFEECQHMALGAGGEVRRGRGGFGGRACFRSGPL
jgi:hypothetical protein